MKDTVSKITDAEVHARQIYGSIQDSNQYVSILEVIKEAQRQAIEAYKAKLKVTPIYLMDCQVYHDNMSLTLTEEFVDRVGDSPELKID